MPDYDFNCRSCNSDFSLTYPSFSAYDTVKTHHCVYCNSNQTVRKIGRVALAKGENRRLDELADHTKIDESDPQAVEGFIKKLGQELGTDLNDNAK